ncbi:protein kinase [Candidatus Uabimicrobium sp. HlEnr_7]|uniref:protein kinase domain-containing protein n=1 Tax=Candidatus Uabimicrobium helgolandensis TaxID=3095367 RepID=UPI0035565A17
MRINTAVLHKDIMFVELTKESLEKKTLQDCLDEISQQGFLKIVCSLKGLNSISPNILTTLLSKLSLIRQQGGDIFFVNVSDILKGVFRYAGCKEEEIFLDDVSTALNEFLAREASSYAATIKNFYIENIVTCSLSKEEIEEHDETVKVESTQRMDREKYAVTQKRSLPSILKIHPENESEIALLGHSQKISTVHQQILRISLENSSTLLLGKDSCGEDAIAYSIHKNSNCQGIFTTIDCSTLESGNKINQITPKISLTVKGSVYLKNIGMLSDKEQNTLHSVLTKFSPDINAICYCCKDSIAQLSFNINSFFSKNIIQVPTLSERKEDIIALAEAYACYYGKQDNKQISRINEKSKKFLTQHDWSSDLTELKKIIQDYVEKTPPQEQELNIKQPKTKPTRTLNNYHLINKIGEGGMGEVWQGKHDTLERPVVIKLIREDTHEEDLEINLKRFQLEAKTIAELQSPHTITLYDFGIHQENTIYYVMEMLHGMDLQELVTKFGAIPPERTIYLLSQICLSLMEAHSFGIIHRDIKPQNIFLCKLGAQFDFIKVLDFGIVKRQGDISNLTGDNIVGSPYFMAPELAISEEIDIKVDVYSFGCTAYWLLSGRYIFHGKNILSLITQHVNENPKPLSQVSKFEIPQELDDLIVECLQKKPQKRPSIKEIRQRLENIKLEKNWSLESSQVWWEKYLSNFIM